MDEIPYRSSFPDINWPAIVTPGGARKLAILFQLEQSQWWSTAQLQQVQFLQIQNIIRFAQATVPHYQKNGLQRLNPDKLDANRWLDIPILTRPQLQTAGREMHSSRPLKTHGQHLPVRTSGSTGTPVELLSTAVTGMFWQVFCLRDHLWHRRDFAGKLAAIRVNTDRQTINSPGKASPGWGGATNDLIVTGPSVGFNILSDISFLAKELQKEAPSYLLTHPSALLGLARYCMENSIQLPFLREVRTLGESLSDSLREVCRQAWDVPLVDMYTCQEAGYLALQCPDHEHYHVQSENILLEVLDENDRPCEPGQTGRVVITTLHNYATPLIRYEIGDCAEVGEPCPCGRGLPVLKRLNGRYRNLLTLPDGRQRWPLLGYESGLQEIAPIDYMQLIQHRVDEIEVRLIMPRPLHAGEAETLTAFIHANLGHPFPLRFEYVETIRNQKNGKIEQFISRL